MTNDTMPAGPELDRLIAEKVMGWVRGGAGDHTSPAHMKETRKRVGEPAEVVAVLDWGQKGPHDYLMFHGIKVMLCGCETHPGHEIPRFSTDITAAWEVVEHLRTHGINLMIAAFSDDLWDCAVAGDGDWDGLEAFTRADTAPLAICRAALKAVS